MDPMPDLPSPTRRRFLGGGALLGVAWISAQVAGHWPLGPVRSAALGPRRRTLEAAFRVFLPGDEDARIAADGVDSFMAGADPVDREALSLALLVLEHLGGAGPLSFRRFSRLSPERQAEVLESWGASGLGLKRQVHQGIRKAALFTHYSRPETWAGIGYDGPQVGR